MSLYPVEGEPCAISSCTNSMYVKVEYPFHMLLGHLIALEVG